MVTQPPNHYHVIIITNKLRNAHVEICHNYIGRTSATEGRKKKLDGSVTNCVNEAWNSEGRIVCVGKWMCPYFEHPILM